jgi:hypothetical protein
VEQFADLVGPSEDAADPGVARLTPDAYPDDAEAARDFRDLTRAELLSRRSDDAGTMLRTLQADGTLPAVGELSDEAAEESHVLALDGAEATAWMRTLSALRLVLASRMGIENDGDRPVGDPRYMLYEWLGMRLEGLVEAATPED